MGRPRLRRSTASPPQAAPATCEAVSDVQCHLPSSSSLPSAETEAVLTSFRAHSSGGVVLFVGDSIAEELAQYLHEKVGMNEVLWCTKPGASPAEIMLHLRALLTVPDNVVLFKKAVLLIVCAGTNLARSTPSLIADEVHNHLIVPLSALLACPMIIIGPITREHFESAVDDCGIQGGASCGTTRNERRAGASSSMLHQSNLELERRSLDSGYDFVNLFNGRLSVTDFRDNLHLKDEGYLKMLRAVLEVKEGESRAPGGVARAPPCAASSVPIMSSLCSDATPSVAASAQAVVPVVGASEHHLLRSGAAPAVAASVQAAVPVAGAFEHQLLRSGAAPAVAASAQAAVPVAGASEHHLSAGHPSVESSSDQEFQQGSRAPSGAPASKRSRRTNPASHRAHEDDRSAQGKHGATLSVAPIASLIKRKRGGAAPSSSSSRPGLTDPPDVPDDLSIEGLLSERQEKNQRQRIEAESIHAQLSKAMATGVNPSPFLKKLYNVGSGTSALVAGSVARDGDSVSGNCLDGGSCGTTGIASSQGTSAEVAGAANTDLSERSPSDSENGAGPRVRIEPATVVPNDPAQSQLLNTVAEVADVVEAQQQQQQKQQQQQQEPDQQQQQQRRRKAGKVVPAIEKTWALFPMSNTTVQAKLNVVIQEQNQDAHDESDEETGDAFEAGEAFEEVTRSLVETSLKTSHEVFKCTINGMLETTTKSLETELVRAPQQVVSNLPLKIRALVQQMQSEHEEERLAVSATRVHLDAVQRAADQLEVQDAQHDSLRQALSKGLHRDLQYGDLWLTLPEAEAFVHSRPGPTLRNVTGQSSKCKAFVCGTRPRDDNKGRVERHFTDGKCKCIIFLQQVTMKQLRSGSYYPSLWTKHVVQDQGNPVPLLPDLRPDLAPDQVVWACVLTHRHTCMALDPPRVPRMGLEDGEAASGDGPLGDGRISCGASNAQSTSTIPSSASAMVAAPRLNRKMKATTHYGLLKAPFDARDGKWKAQDVLHEMLQYDPSASLTMAFSVLRLLKAPSLLTPEFNVSMMFGLARNLSDQGFGIVPTW